MDFIANILAKLDDETAKTKLDNLTKKQKVDLEVRLTGDTDVSKILSKLDSSFASAGQDAGKSYSKGVQAGLKSYKFNGDTFYKQYFDKAKKDIDEAKTVQTKFSKLLSGLDTKGIDKNALKAARAYNKENSAIQKEQEKAVNAQKRILVQQRIAEMKSQAIQKNARRDELVQQGKDNISNWSQQYDKQYRENQKAYFKQVEEYNKRELEYIQKRKEYEAQGKKQAQDDADGRALVSAYKDASEYQKRETEYLKLRNQYIAEGKKQEQEYYLEQKKQQKINEQNIAQTRANEESKKRIQAQQRIAELQNDAIQKNAHTNELVQQGKDNIAKWKQQYNEKQKDADGIALVEAYKQASEYQQKESEYLKLRSQYISEGKKQEQDYYSKQQKNIKNQQEQLKSYTDTFNNGKYSADSKTMSANLEKYNGQNTDSLEKARNYLKEYQDTYKEIQNHFDTTSAINFKDDELVQKFDKLETAASKYRNVMREVSTESSKTLSANAGIVKSNEILTYYNNNTKAIKKYGAELRQLAEDAKNATTQAKLDEINDSFKKLKSTISAEGLTGKSPFDEAKRAFFQIAEFTGMYGILQNVIQDVPRAIVQNVIKIDDAMTNLRMATSVSNDEAKKLMKTYSEMGKELKVLGTDIATSSTEWLKQGKSIQESEKLTRDSVILSKIGDLSSEDATKTITAAMKSYDLAESQVMGFIDQISSIDMASATDVGGLSQAFNEVAANAKNAGIETEKLLSYAAVIGETSQEGMASVGTSLNAIFSRMGNIKLSRLKDYENDGEDLSNVETVLKKNGIALRDATGQFKEFDDVLDETASKWKNFDSVTQRAVANAFAG